MAKSNFWELYHNKKGELCFHLLNGNNRKKLIASTEGYKNQQSCLKLLHDHVGDKKVYYVEPGSTIGVEVTVDLLMGVYRITDFSFKRISIPTASRALLIAKKNKRKQVM